MAAIHFENLLFLLFIFVAFLFQVLTRAATKANKQSGKRKSTTLPHSPPPIPRAPAETDQERIRKFLEALGQPPSSAPPPPVKPRPTYEKPIILPHVGPGPSPLPPLTTRPPDLPRTKRVFQPQTSAPVFEVHKTTAPVEPSSPPIAIPAATPYALPTQPALVRPEDKIALAILLSSSSGLRNAIILREIFGPPRSLQPLDLMGSA